MTLARPASSQRMRGLVGIRLLSAIAFISVLAVITLFISLISLESQRDAMVREDAMWTVFQTDRHIRQTQAMADLIAARRDRTAHAEFVTDYDILYSRAAQLTRTSDILDIDDDGHLAARAEPLVDFIVGLAPTIDSLDPQAADYFDRVAEIGSMLVPFIDLSNAVVLDANQQLNEQRVAERADRQRTHGFLAFLGVLLTSAFLGIFFIMLLQVRSISRQNRLLALQRERSSRTAARAEAARKAMSVFLATMSHEIRTPLNGIIGSAELLSVEDDAATQSRRLAAIRASGFLLRDLIDDILALSRLRAEGVETDTSETDLRALGELLYNAFVVDVRKAGLALEISMPPARVMVNASRVRQVLVNLIGNAIKFTPKGAIRVEGTMVSDTVLRVTVKDDGIGISQADIGKLFHDFTQVDGSYSRTYQGSGLGLAISKRVIEGLGGLIGVESKPGEGSTFWFELPVEYIGESATLPVKAATLDRARNALKILIAEDNEVNLGVLRDMLLHLGHTVIEARNGKEAVDLLAKEKADMLLIDCQMPIMDGVEATRHIRQKDRTIPIIGVSANSYERDRRRCLEAGMTDFLSKPLTFGSLSKALEPYIPDPGHEVPAKETATSEPDAALNPHLRSLAQSLGAGALGAFIDRFETDIAAFESAVTKAVKNGDITAQRFQLHTFTGAAQALGLDATAQCASDLRQSMPLTQDTVGILVARAEADIIRVRAALRAGVQVE